MHNNTCKKVKNENAQLSGIAEVLSAFTFRITLKMDRITGENIIK